MKERFASLAEVFETLEQTRKENALLKGAIASKATELAEVLGQLRKENKLLRETLTSVAEELHEIYEIHGDPGDMTRTPTRKIHELAESLDDMMKPAEQEAS